MLVVALFCCLWIAVTLGLGIRFGFGFLLLVVCMVAVRGWFCVGGLYLVYTG